MNALERSKSFLKAESVESNEAAMAIVWSISRSVERIICAVWQFLAKKKVLV